MRLPRPCALLAASLTLCVAGGAYAASPGHEECERQFKRLSRGGVLEVPEVPDWGDAREYYFAWNRGSKSKPIKIKGGTATGSCIIDKRTGKGSATLNAKDLGEFVAPSARR